MENLKVPASVKKWNRKIHIYLGLYMLFFLWLFSVSGLLLNHVQDWFSHQRPAVEELTRAIEPPTADENAGKAVELMKQLGWSGEIVLGPSLPRDGHFYFRILELDHLIFVDADLNNYQAKLRVVPRRWTQFMVDMHAFTGVRRAWGEPVPSTRDWWMTKVWSFCIDAIAAGLMVTVLTAIYMWYQLKKKRRLGLIVLSSGVLVCSFFLWGLRWLT